MVKANLRIASFLLKRKCTIAIRNEFAGEFRRRRIDVAETKLPLTSIRVIEERLAAVVRSYTTRFKAVKSAVLSASVTGRKLSR